VSAAGAATAMLDVEQIEVAYGKARAVNGATLRVAEGSITAIVGPNGAGKTSLLKAVSGLQPIHAGTIRFRGARIDARPSARSPPSASPTSPRAAASSPR
jgi:ABC-type branched-chain amino acid transport systems, ATPase component